MKKPISALILCLAIIQLSYSQVSTRRIKDNSNNIQQLRSAPQLRPKVNMASVDVAALLEEDRNDDSGLPPRFGKAMDVNISLGDGRWEALSNGRLWTLDIESTGALSINLIFDKFHLPQGAEFYMFNKEREIVFGPVTSDQNNEQHVFSTDVMEGSLVTLQLFEPLGSVGKSELHLEKVVHGYKNLTNYVGFGDSAPCHNDINCAVGNAWQDESDAVALILLDNGQRHCSGVLLNNGCQDFTPSFLTAFHCLDTEGLVPNNILSNNERNAVQNWVFRFQYKSPSCNGNDDFQFFSFSGANFRSAWVNSDFALLELFQRPQANTGIRYAGWSRALNAPNSAVGIHHPRGDVMKISVENNNVVPVAWFGGAQDHWRAIFDNGTVEHGSSGSPLFDQNGRVVGQLHGNQNNGCFPQDNSNCFCTQVRVGEYGRIDASWNGGGTAATRLSTWLTNDPNVMQTNTIRIPSISGQPNLCSSGTTFSISNVPAGQNVTWSVSPTSYVATSSGSGTTANLQPSNSFVSGGASITFTLNDGNGCPNASFSRSFWVGKPRFNDASIQGNSSVHCQSIYIYDFNGTISGNASYVWETSGHLDDISYATLPEAFIQPTNGGSAFISVKATNSCGSSYICKTVNVSTSYPCGPGLITFPGSHPCAPFGFFNVNTYPNPVSNVLTIEMEGVSQALSKDIKVGGDSPSLEVSLYDFNQRLIYQSTMTQDIHQVETRSLKKGLYILKISHGKQEVHEQTVVIE